IPIYIMSLFSFHISLDHSALHSFPTRRSSDLNATATPPACDLRSGGGAPMSPPFRGSWRLSYSTTPLKKAPVARPAGFHQVAVRSEEHTSELQSRGHLVCRLLLEKKNPIDEGA